MATIMTSTFPTALGNEDVYACLESTNALMSLTPIPSAILSPTNSASYSASLFEASNSKRSAYVNSIPSGFMSIRPEPKPPSFEEPSVNKIYISAVVPVGPLVRLTFFTGSSTRETARTWPRMEVLGR
ncbi:hypothetical protein Tco_0998553 [Tanacetum coccineum]